MTKQVGIGIGVVVALAAGALILWLTLPNDSNQQNGEPTLSNTEPLPNVSAQDVDSETAPQSTSSPPSTTQAPAITSSGLVHEPERMGAAYLDARDEVEALLNGFRTELDVVRSRIVEVDNEYAARFIRGVVRDIDALDGFVGALSETFDMSIFPDTPCTLSYVASGFRGPRVTSVETSPGVFVTVEDEAGGEVVHLDSHCGSSSEVTSAQVRIDTFEGTIFIELVNDRVVQRLMSLDTEGFMLAIEFDAKSFPPRNQEH